MGRGSSAAATGTSKSTPTAKTRTSAESRAWNQIPAHKQHIVTHEYVAKLRREGWPDDLVRAAERAIRTNPVLTDREMELLRRSNPARGTIRAAEEARDRARQAEIRAEGRGRLGRSLARVRKSVRSAA